MTAKTKAWLIAGAILIFVGLLIFSGVMTMLKWDFNNLSTNKYTEKTYVIDEPFTDISVNIRGADIVFLPSPDGKCKVVCFESDHETHFPKVEDGTLSIDSYVKKGFYIGINFKSPKIKVYLPQSAYGVLDVNTSAGDVNIPKDFSFESISVSVRTGNIKGFASASDFVKLTATTGHIYYGNASAVSFDFKVSTGDIELHSLSAEKDVTLFVSTGECELFDVSCKSLISEGNTGDISLEDVKASGSFNIKRSTGDIDFERCDAAEIYIETSTGDVEGSLLSGKSFDAKATTGKVKVPKSSDGGICKITTSTGDIEIEVLNP